MKRLRSTDDLDSYGDKNTNRSSSSHRSSYYSKPTEPSHKPLPPPSSSRYDRDHSLDDEARDSSRSLRKRSDHDPEAFDRRKGPAFDRYSERKGYAADFPERGDAYSASRGLIRRSDSFSGSKREFPKGYRSQRDRSRHEGSLSSSSWQRIGSMGMDIDETRGTRSGYTEDRERKGLREVRSPSRSKDSGSEQSKRGFRDGKSRESDKEKSPSMSRGDSVNEPLSKSRSPPHRFIGRKVRSRERSPSCSSDQSRSLEAKKNEELQIECGSTSEMEEGELEPETKLEPHLAADAENGDGIASIQRDEHKEDEHLPDQVKSPGASSTPSSSSCGSGDGDEGEVRKAEEIVRPVDIERSKGHQERAKEVNGHSAVEEQVQMEMDFNEEKAIEVTAEKGDVSDINTIREVQEERVHEGSLRLPREGSTLDFMDKGKSIAVAAAGYIETLEVSASIKDESRDVALNKEICLEGPSTRGFELFSSSPVRRAEKSDQSGFNKSKQEKQPLEPLDLSLSLPSVLLPIGAPETSAPASPSQGRSIQSWSTFRTNSDAFTMSMSFSGSQSFFHNPSCSLTQNEMDFEKSVGSRPIFGGVDWEGLAQNESKPKEVPQYPRITMNGNGSIHAAQGEHASSNGQPIHSQNQNVRALEGGSRMQKGLERQLIFQKQNPGQLRMHDEAKSPAQSVGSHEIGSSYNFERKVAATRDKSVGGLHRTASLKDGEKIWFGGIESFEANIEKIITEPVSEVARKFHEMRGDVLSSLKERVREILQNPDKHGQVLAFQKALQNPSDMTLEALSGAHRTHLEILVAIKTGLPDFLQPASVVSSSDLAEIFLNLKCRNLACRSALPVNECDCKVCGPRNGFCSDCMCLVCSKFDMASNTCKWVGCDVCLHWCHVECALRESYIRNGQSATGAQGATEMQFHCVACDHPSEMFGFVKEVFQNFAREWTAENLYRELEYVKRVFRGSKDVRGRRLFEIADQILPRLASKANLTEMYSYIMSFLNDSDSSKFAAETPKFLTNYSSGAEQGRSGNGIIGSKQQDMTWLKSVYSEKSPLPMEHANTLLQSSNLDRNDKLASSSDMQRSSQIPVFDELDSIIRIKQAEASMFQSRADDARRESEGLKRIAMAKNEKIEEEYTARIAKLRLAEAEENRKQKYEELQTLERAHRDYFNMKLRMESDIKDLLLKMEATKRNLAM